jgi:hypothetical protein
VNVVNDGGDGAYGGCGGDGYRLELAFSFVCLLPLLL